MSTCFLARHVRSAPVRESMEGPEVRARLAMRGSIRWTTPISRSDLEEPLAKGAEGEKKRWHDDDDDDQAFGCTGRVRCG